jgi:Glycosyl transferases group 1
MYEALTSIAPVDILLLRESDTNEAKGGDRAEVIADLSWKQPPLTVYKFGVHRWVNAWCHANLDLAQYDLVVGRDLAPISKVEWPKHIWRILDSDDIYYRYAPAGNRAMARGIAASKTWLRFWQAKLALEKFDHVFFCSSRDQKLFAVRSSSILPNVVVSREGYKTPPESHDPTALIVGSMSYPPNRQGVEWFLEHCWPAVTKQCPPLKLRIVGAAPPHVLERWSRVPQTDAPGFVPELATEYARAWFAIAPVRHGGGSCIKFLEAAAFWRACIITAHVWEPFRDDFREGESVLVGHDAGGMVRSCTSLFESSQYRTTIAQRARDIVARLYTPERFRKAVVSAVGTIMESPGAISGRR